jgi:hypothetical protein
VVFISLECRPQSSNQLAALSWASRQDDGRCIRAYCRRDRSRRLLQTSSLVFRTIVAESVSSRCVRCTHRLRSSPAAVCGTAAIPCWARYAKNGRPQDALGRDRTSATVSALPMLMVHLKPLQRSRLTLRERGTLILPLPCTFTRPRGAAADETETPAGNDAPADTASHPAASHLLRTRQQLAHGLRLDGPPLQTTHLTTSPPGPQRRGAACSKQDDTQQIATQRASRAG